MHHSSLASLTAFAGIFISSVSAHGFIATPLQRLPGTAMEAVCGNTIYNNQKSDKAGPVQLLMQSASSIVDKSKCNLWLCKGYQFDDNKANIQKYTLGQVVPMTIEIVAPHTGYANVSIVDTKSNSILATMKSWSVYASTSTGVKPDEKTFSVTIPTTLKGCTTAGQCVIQWFWYAPPGVDQTYEGCVDFVVGGGAAAGGAAPKKPNSAKPKFNSLVPIPTDAPTYNPYPTAYPTTLETRVSSAPPPSAPSSSAPSSSVPSSAPSSSAPSSSAPSSSAPSSSAPSSAPSSAAPSSPSAAPVPAPSGGAPSGCSATPVEYNKCMDKVNECIRNAQSKNGGAASFLACDSARAACKQC